MRNIVFSLLTLFFASTATASEITIPSEPRLRDLPKVNYLGGKIGLLAMYATSVTRLANGELVVMYGFITGSPNGTSSYFYWNDKLNMECHGYTTRMKDKSGKGSLICTENGVTFIDDTLLIPTGKYMRIKGVSTHKNVDTKGRTVWTVIQWQGRSKFPKPEPLIDTFK